MNLRQSAPLLFLALLPAAGGGLSAQEDRLHRDEPPAAVHVEVAEPPSEPAPPETTPPEPPAEPPSETPVESPPDTQAPPDRYAVPVTETPEPRRQPPSRDRRDPNPPPDDGGGDDGGYVPEEEPLVESYEDEESPGGWFGGNPGRPAVGALDLDLSPGRTQVYLDGQYLGIVDQFDGWPSYLLLPEGSYELVFYLDGYRTLARRVALRPGSLIKINDRLVQGPSVRPEDLLGEGVRPDW